MKKTLLSAATLLALATAAPLAAHEDRSCLDEGCMLQSLFAEPDTAGTTVPTIAAQRFGTWGIDTAGMDRQAKPGTDFFRYVSGTWADTTQIPADRSSYGGFAILRDLSEARLRVLVEGYALGDPATGATPPRLRRCTGASWTRRRSKRSGRSPCSRSWPTSAQPGTGTRWPA